MPKRIAVKQTPINTLNTKPKQPVFNLTISLVNGDTIHVNDVTILGIGNSLAALSEFDIFSVEATRQ